MICVQSDSAKIQLKISILAQQLYDAINKYYNNKILEKAIM